MTNRCLECGRKFGSVKMAGLIAVEVERKDPEIDICSDCLEEIELNQKDLRE